MFSCNTDETKTSHIFQSCKQGSTKVKKIGDYLYHYDYQIGSGTYSQVYEGVSLINDKPVAVKVIDLELVKQKRLIQLLYQQTQLMSQLNHPNVIKCYALLKSQNRCYIVTQLCRKDNLQDLVQKTKNKKLPLSEIERIIYDVYQGLSYLSQRAIIHRDLKTANILFSQTGKAKIADFGFATHGLNQFQDNVFVGTPLYMSPQAILEQKYSAKTDIWSFGIIIYQLMFGYAPMSNCKNQQQLLSMIVKPVKMPTNQTVSQQLCELLTGCLEPNSVYRWNIDKVGKCRYIQGLKRKYFIQTNQTQSLKIRPPQGKTYGQNTILNRNSAGNAKFYTSLQLKPVNAQHATTASTNFQQLNSRVSINRFKTLNNGLTISFHSPQVNQQTQMSPQNGLIINQKNPNINSVNNVGNSKSIMNLNPNHQSSITYAANTFGSMQNTKKPSSGRFINNNSDINSRCMYNPANNAQVSRNAYNPVDQNGMSSRYAINNINGLNNTPNLQRHSISGNESKINLSKRQQNNYVSNQQQTNNKGSQQANKNINSHQQRAIRQLSLNEQQASFQYHQQQQLRQQYHQQVLHNQLSTNNLVQLQQVQFQQQTQMQSRRSQLPANMNVRKTQSNKESMPNHFAQRKSQLSPYSIHSPNLIKTMSNTSNPPQNYNNQRNQITQSHSLFLSRQLSYKQAVSLVHYCRLLHKILQFPRYFHWYLRQWLLFLIKDLKQNAQVNSLKPEHTTSLKNVLQGYYSQYISQNNTDSRNNNSEAVPQIKSVVKILKNLLQIDLKNGQKNLEKQLLNSLIQQTQNLQKCISSNESHFQSFAKQTKCQIYLDMFNKTNEDSKVKINCIE